LGRKKTDPAIKEQQINKIYEDINAGLEVRRILEKEHVSHKTYKEAEKKWLYNNSPKPSEVKGFKSRIQNLEQLRREKTISESTFDDRKREIYDNYDLTNNVLRESTFSAAKHKKSIKTEKLPRIEKLIKRKNRVQPSKKTAKRRQIQEYKKDHPTKRELAWQKIERTIIKPKENDLFDPPSFWDKDKRDKHKKSYENRKPRKQTKTTKKRQF
jgi:hypothetical protein